MCGIFCWNTYSKVYGYIKCIVCIHSLYVNIVIYINIFLHNILNCEELYPTIKSKQEVSKTELGAFYLLMTTIGLNA